MSCEFKLSVLSHEKNPLCVLPCMYSNSILPKTQQHKAKAREKPKKK